MKKFILTVSFFALFCGLIFAAPWSGMPLNQSPTASIAGWLQVVTNEPSVQAAFVNDQGSGSGIRTYAGTDIPTATGAVTYGTSSLFLSTPSCLQTNNSTSITGSTYWTCSSTATGNVDFNQNWSFEFVFDPNVSASGDLWGKPVPGGAVFWQIYLGDPPNLAYGSAGNKMEMYLYTSSGAGILITGAFCTISNGYVYDVVLAYNPSNPMHPDWYVNGSHIPSSLNNTGTIGTFADGTHAVLCANGSHLNLFDGTNQATAIYTSTLNPYQVLCHYLALNGQAVSNNLCYSSFHGFDNTGAAINCYNMFFFWTGSFYCIYGTQASTDYYDSGAGDWLNTATNIVLYTAPNLSSGISSSNSLWTNNGVVITTVNYAWPTAAAQGASQLSGFSMMTNAANANFVGWNNSLSNNLAASYAQVWTAPGPTGPWSLVSSNTLCNGVQPGDLHCFLDPISGNGYVIYNAFGTGSVYVSELNSTFTATTGSATKVNVNAGIGSFEGCSLSYSNGYYFAVMSPQTAYGGTANEGGSGLVGPYVSYCTSLLGTWSSLVSIYPTGRNPYGVSGQMQQSRSQSILADGRILQSGDCWNTMFLTNTATVWGVANISGSTYTVTPTNEFAP
jgi:hypothetical protein